MRNNTIKIKLAIGENLKLSDDKQNEEEIKIEIKSNETDSEKEEETPESQTKSNEHAITELQSLIEQEKQKLTSCEDKLKRALADYQNLERKTKSDIVNGVNEKIDQFMLKFLPIYDDLVRAKEILTEQKSDLQGLQSIIKNIEGLLLEYGVKPIDALGEIFDPKLHDAVSVVEDSKLDDGTITKEIRKGYISQNRVIRPAIVEISKKPKTDLGE